MEHNTANIQTTPDNSWASAIMLAIFWTEYDFFIISDCKNLFYNKLKNLWTNQKKKKERKNINPPNTHLKSPLRKKNANTAFMS